MFGKFRKHPKYPVQEIEITYKPTYNIFERPEINRPQDAYRVISELWPKGTIELREAFYVICISASDNVLGVWTGGLGDHMGSRVDIRLTLATALKANAHSIILAHNHPGGDHRPSNEDMTITRNFYEACKIVGIFLMDHIIISSKGYYSFSDSGFFSKK